MEGKEEWENYIWEKLVREKALNKNYTWADVSKGEDGCEKEALKWLKLPLSADDNDPWWNEGRLGNVGSRW